MIDDFEFINALIKFFRYGQPPKGSRTEERGLAAQAHIQQEVRFLCETIKTIGTEVENESMTIYEITFKQLFDVNQRIERNY